MSGKNKSNILIYSQHFWPENFPINSITNFIAKKHYVSVLTGRPNYPNGEIYNKYLKNKNNFRNYFGVKVNRLHIIPRKKSSVFNLLSNYLSFISLAFFLSPFIFKNKKVDHIFVYGTSPLIQVLGALSLKLFKRAKLHLWVLDLWPDDMISTGYIKNNNFISKGIIKVNELLMTFAYYFCDSIFVQSKDFIPKIKHLTNNKNIYYLPNPAPVSLVDNNKIHYSIRLLNKYFSITYAGNIGNNHDYELIINAAIELQKNKMIRFFIYGGGSNYRNFVNLIKKNNLKNIFCYGFVEQDYINPILSNSDLLFTSFKKANNLSLTIPARIQSYMQAGKFIIVAADGAVSKLIKRVNCGYVSPSGNVFSFVKNILEAYRLSENKRLIMGKNGFLYYEKNYTVNKFYITLMRRLNKFNDS